MTLTETDNKYGSCPLWLVDYLNNSPYYPVDEGKTNISGIYGYWTLSASLNGPGDVNIVDSIGVVIIAQNHLDTNDSLGIRPVITLKI